jgi:hypothetical protein
MNLIVKGRCALARLEAKILSSGANAWGHLTVAARQGVRCRKPCSNRGTVQFMLLAVTTRRAGEEQSGRTRLELSAYNSSPVYSAP